MGVCLKTQRDLLSKKKNLIIKKTGCFVILVVSSLYNTRQSKRYICPLLAKCVVLFKSGPNVSVYKKKKKELPLVFKIKVSHVLMLIILEFMSRLFHGMT